MSMTGRERMRLAMRRQRPDRVPTMPQLCHPHAIHVLREDYRRGIAETIERPTLCHELALEIAELYGVDGLRLFPTSDPMHVVDQNDELIAVSPRTGQRIGHVDLHGGGHVVLDEAVLPVESADDLNKLPRVRCETLMQSSALEDLANTTDRAGGNGGGYILAAGDMVPDMTPEANVRAMVKAARDCCYDAKDGADE